MTTTALPRVEPRVAPPALPRIALRPAGAADTPALRDLADAHFADLLPGLPATVLVLQARAQERGYRTSYPEAHELVIDLGGAVAGRLLVDGAAPEYHLVDIVVHPALRGGGLGSAALRGWLADVDRAGAAVTLRVGGLSPARRWYERNGFTDDPGAIDDPVHMTMRREAT